MAKQREKVEFRYYEIGEDEPVLALLGEEWIREYGKEIKCLHFHNLMEIGYCQLGHRGSDSWSGAYLLFTGDNYAGAPKAPSHYKQRKRVQKLLGVDVC